jgi:hypothetical protein
MAIKMGIWEGFKRNWLGIKFDFIIIHESDTSGLLIITYKGRYVDSREFYELFWESLLEYYYGKEAGYTYVRGLRNIIDNDKPIIGKYDVNNEGSGDMYLKVQTCCTPYVNGE